MDQKLKHLEFIQGVINRLATNSFQMKGPANTRHPQALHSLAST